MTVYLQDPDVTLYHGDALETLRGMPDESVHCVVTSPPYWGLRDYSAPGQMGLEPTPELYVLNMVTVFREVRRVLRRDGTCWLNIGDSYNVRGPKGENGHDKSTLTGGGPAYQQQVSRSSPRVADLKPKDLVGIPWRLAFALQADGWWLRADIIWAKPNPMPESVTDRPTKAHEYVFLLTRSPRYYFDAEAVREKAEYGYRLQRGNGSMYDRVGDGANQPERQPGTTVYGADPSTGRNSRSVWEIATEPFPAAHFATFPTELASRCILAGTSERGCCPQCGAPWVREIERELGERTGGSGGTKLGPGKYREGMASVAETWVPSRLNVKTLGWQPTCDHHTHPFEQDSYCKPVPCTVLDPFAGACTVPLVARKHGRHSIGIELSETYLREIALPRLQQLSLLA